MLKKYIYILIIVFFAFSCSDIESEIQGDWYPSERSIASRSNIDSDLNEHHKTELIEKLSSKISSSIVYSFKNRANLEISHLNNDERISMSAKWKIESNFLIVEIDNQPSQRYNLEIKADTMTLTDRGASIIFYRKK